jgi:NTE family protein
MFALPFNAGMPMRHSYRPAHGSVGEAHEMTVLPFWRRGRRVDGSQRRPAPRDAVVFSGGGSLGAAQVGALQALFEAGVTPDVVVGCSVGALNAAYVAVDPRAERVAALEGVWRALSRDVVFPDGRFGVARRLARRRSHLYSDTGLRDIIESCVPVADLADTAIPVHVATTDLLSGQAAWWTSGDPVAVLSATCCLPGIFPPVQLGGSLHVDGGVTSPVPTQHALDLGARRVWVLDVTRAFHGWAGEQLTAMDVLLESFAISRSHLGRQAPVVADGQQVLVLPELRVGRHDLRDFSKTAMLLAAGREAGRAMVAAADLSGRGAGVSASAS